MCVSVCECVLSPSDWDFTKEQGHTGASSVGQAATVCSGFAWCRSAELLQPSVKRRVNVGAAAASGSLLGADHIPEDPSTSNCETDSLLMEGLEAPAAEMIIRLGRLTPGYFQLLQRQVSGEVRMQPQGSFIDPIAVMMASVGTGLCLYSSRQMAERVQLKQPLA